MDDINESSFWILDQELIGYHYLSCCFCSSCWDDGLQKRLRVPRFKPYWGEILHFFKFMIRRHTFQMAAMTFAHPLPASLLSACDSFHWLAVCTGFWSILHSYKHTRALCWCGWNFRGCTAELCSPFLSIDAVFVLCMIAGLSQNDTQLFWAGLSHAGNRVSYYFLVSTVYSYTYLGML